MSNLQLIWFILIGVLFAGFFFLEGFDFGVGMSTKFLAHDQSERDQLVGTIGPVWDGNEVWLITAGGAMFASFPGWYATLFSGYYLLFFLILFGLIIRGVSFEFRNKMKTAKNNKIWDWTLFLGSLLAPFMFGVIFTSMVSGIPIDQTGNIHAGFFNYFNLFSLVGGIALTLLCYLHGLHYIRLKTIGDIRKRAGEQMKKLYYLLYAGLIIFAILLAFYTDFYQIHPATTWSLLLAIVLLSVVAHYGTLKNKEMLSFLASGVTLIALVALLFTGVFPNVIIGTDTANTLSIVNASSQPYTLNVMTKIAVVMVPVVLLYQGYTYWVFRKRLGKGQMVDRK